MANDFQNMVTPPGVAVYPHLTTPDTKFDANGVYKVSLSLTEEEAAPLIERVEKVQEEATGMIPPGKRQKLSDPPYYDEMDDQGQPTGRVIFKFKMKAKVNTKDGRTLEMSPKLFDSEGTLMTDVESIWGGSVLRISADMIPFYVAAVGAGVSLRLKAVQIIDLKTGGGAGAESYGFEATKGYVAPQAEELVEAEFAADAEDF